MEIIRSTDRGQCVACARPLSHVPPETPPANHLSRKHADVYKTSSTASGNATQSSASSGKRSHSQSQSLLVVFF